MANEARVFAEGTSSNIAYQFTVADGTAIAKGSVLVSAGDRTAKIHATVTDRFLGIATSSKEASDGCTEIGAQCTGVAEMYIDGVVTTGDLVVLGSTVNRVRRMNITAAGLSYQELQALVGRAMESGTDGTKIKVLLGWGL